MPTHEPEPIAEPLRRLLSVFSDDLAEVTFPGVDAASLGRLAETVTERAAEVTLAMAQVEAARTELRDAQSRLLATARQAQAYARIYAEGKDELFERVDSIRLSERPIAPRKRRTKKAGPRPTPTANPEPPPVTETGDARDPVAAESAA